VAADRQARVDRGLVSLDGLSIGDSFGDILFLDEARIEARSTPPAPWRTTDDTEMAIAIVDVLRRDGTVGEDALALAFARRFRVDPYRGYGAGSRAVLAEILAGRGWEEAASGSFGNGSMGNGAAMRAAPLGAYFADDLAVIVDEARRSAVVTHAHPDGQAGAIAVAVAAGCLSARGDEVDPSSLFEVVLDATPPGPTRVGIERAASLPLASEPIAVAIEVGAGWKTLCSDTVPFCLWVTARHLGDFESALWTAVSVPGDRDTVGAIVGGMIAAGTGPDGLPREWLEARESLRHDLDRAAA
jgi:ADP-ribosylglycohydrolase